MILAHPAAGDLPAPHLPAGELLDSSALVEAGSGWLLSDLVVLGAEEAESDPDTWAPWTDDVAFWPGQD